MDGKQRRLRTGVAADSPGAGETAFARPACPVHRGREQVIFDQIHSPERDPMNTTEEPATTMATASAPHVLEVIQSMQRELAELLQQRAEIMRRVGTIRQTLAGLA